MTGRGLVSLWTLYHGWVDAHCDYTDARYQGSTSISVVNTSSQDSEACPWQCSGGLLGNTQVYHTKQCRDTADHKELELSGNSVDHVTRTSAGRTLPRHVVKI